MASGFFSLMKRIVGYIFLFFYFGVNAQVGCSYWSTYIGKTNSEEIRGMAIDNNKNSYIIMQTASDSLGVAPGLVSDTLLGFYDAYIAKFDSCGTFIWATYIGTTNFDSGEKIIICTDGNIAFTGYSQGPGLPVTPGCFQAAHAGQADCFLGKITPNGNLVWLSYFGKSGSEFAYDLSCDLNGNLFIGGTTTSANLYTTASSFQQNFGGNTDAFIAKFSAAGVLKWCTYYGGIATEDIHVLTTDGFGNVFGSGGTSSFNLNTSSGCIQASKDNGIDCYIIKLDSSGNRIFSSYLGGNATDDAWGLVTDGIGNLYVAGQTSSTNFTATAGAYQSLNAGMTDMYFAKISPNGNLIYSTLIGGSDVDVVNRMKIYNYELYILGTTASTNFPMLGASNYSILPGFQNLIVIRLTAAGQPNFSTYFGSINGYDNGNDIAVAANSIFFCGRSSSANYPVSSAAYQSVYGSNDDGVLTKLPNNNASIITSLKDREISLNTGMVYPNPAKEKINIKNAGGLQNKIEIVNCFGQVIKEVETTGSGIDISGLNEGIYFLRTENKTYKFIKAN